VSGRDRHPGDRLAALVDGRLGEPDRTRVVEHLATCRECLAEYDAQLALKGVLGGLGAPGAPDELRARLASVPADQPDAPARRHRTALRVGLGSAAGLVGVLAVGGLAYAVGGAAQGVAVVPPANQFLREHAAVSMTLPLSQPVLQQLVPQHVPLVAPAAITPVHRTLPPALGR
jgi:anti-sigma factor RsiW